MSLLKFTIDTNALIDVDENRVDADIIRQLYQFHLSTKIDLAITGITASENQKGGRLISNFADFQKRLLKLGFSEINILKPVRYNGVTFWGWDRWGTVQDFVLDQKIHHIMNPKVEFSYQDYCAKRGINPSAELDKKWRNLKCDVLAIHTHIAGKREIYVTRDSDYFDNDRDKQLCNLGANLILRPTDAITLIVQ